MSSESATESERAKWRSTGLIIAKQDMSDLIAGRLFVLGRIFLLLLLFFNRRTGEQNWTSLTGRKQHIVFHSVSSSFLSSNQPAANKNQAEERRRLRIAQFVQTIVSKMSKKTFEKMLVQSKEKQTFQWFLFLLHLHYL